MSPGRPCQTPTVTEYLSLIRMDIDNLIERSLGAALGTVSISLPAVYTTDGVSERGLVYTDHRINVEKYFGSIEKYFGMEVPSRVVVRTIGGDTEELSMRVPDGPTFTPKERVIVFLSKDTGRRFELAPEVFTTMGWFQGKLTVAGNFVLIPGMRQPLPLDELISKLEGGKFNHG